jgi:hypothetical protein
MNGGAPVRGLEPLAPLVAYLVVYLIFLIILRLLIWPLLVDASHGGGLSRLASRIIGILLRLGAVLLMLVGLLWALDVLGWAEPVYGALGALPVLALDLPGLPEVEIPLLLILAAIVLLVLLRYVLGYVRRVRR